MKIFENISHKEHEGREEHKGGSGIFVRYHIVLFQRSAFGQKHPLPSSL